MPLKKLHNILLCAAFFAFGAQAQNYPAKPVHIVAPYPPGGSLDIVARALGQKLEDELSQRFIIDNRAGASGNIGTDFVAKSAPDGYNLLMGAPSPLALMPHLDPKLPFNPEKDFAPVIWVVNQPNVMLVHPSVPAKSVKEVIALAKSQPGKLTFGSYGVGSSQHIAGELFMLMTGVKLTHVPYAKTSALMDLVGGQINLMIDAVPTALPYIKSNQLKALGVSTSTRSAMLPDVPTIAEAGVPGYDFRGWNVLLAPAGTPKEAIARINAASNKALQSEDLRKRLSDLGLEIVGGTPEKLQAFLKSESETYGRIVKEAHITLQ